MRISDWSSDVCSSDLTTWEFKLREGVTFHDGSPFTARDVVFTVCRIPTVENSPSSFSVYTKGIAGMEVKDEHTLLIKTDTPFPLLPNEVAAWDLLSATANGVPGDIGYSRDGCTGITPQERRGGKEGVRTGRSRGSTSH